MCESLLLSGLGLVGVWCDPGLHDVVLPSVPMTSIQHTRLPDDKGAAADICKYGVVERMKIGLMWVRTE